MSLAYDLVNSLTNAMTETEEDLTTLVIDHPTRTIVIPKGITTLGVESDDEVLRLNFKMPRYLGTVDLYTFSIRINYINARGEDDVYEVTDAKIVGDNVTFSWLVGPTATAYRGNTKFNVCMVIVDSNSVIQREYNTTVATLPVKEGLECSERMISEYTDILDQWYRRLFGEKDSLVADITAVAQAQQQAIEDKAAASLASIPPDYTETYNLAHDSVRTRANAIVCSSEGDIISVADSSDDHIRGFKVFGKTTQLRTTGKNFLNVTLETGTHSNLSVTRYADGRIGIFGTSSGGPIYLQKNLTLSPGTYTFSVGTHLTVPDSNGIWVYGDGVQAFLTNDRSITFTVTQTSVVNVYLFPTNGAYWNTNIYPQIELGAIATEYEPYSGTVSSPSPIWPQELQSVTNPTAYIHGKNWMNNVRDTVTQDGVTFTVNDDKSIVLNGTATQSIYFDLCTDMFLTPGTYRISGAPKDASQDKYYLYIYPDYHADRTGSGYTFTVKENTTFICRIFVGVGTTCDNVVFRPQIEIGTANTEYEPYVEKQSIEIPHILRGIQVTEGGNYTDVNGQQWICDEVDFERGVHVQRVHTVVLDGSENISREERSGGTYRFVIRQSNPKRMQPIVGGCCSHFNYGIEPIGANDVNNVMCFWNTGYPYCRYDDATSVEAMATWLAAQHEAGTPVTIKGVLETPIETPLTQEEIEAFKQMHTNFPRNTVLNDSAAWMEVKYNADTKTFLDNTFRPTNEQVQTAVNAWLEAHFANAEGVSF